VPERRPEATREIVVSILPGSRRTDFSVQPHIGIWPGFLLFPLLRALFFPLFSIVVAPALFLPPFQGFAL
jgi:hypothetical protein